MNHCPITLEPISDDTLYSVHGLKLLAPTLKNLQPLDYSAAEQRAQSITRAGKMSIQGVQAKLSARLKIKDEQFEIVDQYGQYILKPQSEYYPELPQNEALTMSLAALIDIEVPVHGLVYSKDHSMTYFIKRFDRAGHKDKLAVEDFAQLSGMSRDTKYNSSYEKVAKIITDFCTFPKVELIKLFRLTLFNFLVGNEDMHLKNFSLITRKNIVTLSPAYDLLNTTIAQEGTKEELALPLNGKKNNLKKNDFFNYFAKERLALNQQTIEVVFQQISKAIPSWKQLIEDSFLSEAMKKKYSDLLEIRWQELS